MQQSQPRESEPVNLAFPCRRVRKHPLERDVLGGLDLLDDDAADGDIAVSLAGFEKVLVPASFVPDRNALPRCETL